MSHHRLSTEALWRFVFDLYPLEFACRHAGRIYFTTADARGKGRREETSCIVSMRMKMRYRTRKEMCGGSSLALSGPHQLLGKIEEEKGGWVVEKTRERKLHSSSQGPVLNLE